VPLRNLVSYAAWRSSARSASGSAISKPSFRSAVTSVRNFSRLCSAYAEGSSASSALAALLDEQTGRYRELHGARQLGEYVDRARTREDEELLIEPILAALIERTLGTRRCHGRATRRVMMTVPLNDRPELMRWHV
jgi:hypothetical protein